MQRTGGLQVEALGALGTDGLLVHVARGPVIDQAELHGVISRIRDLGLTLITVQRMDEK